MPEFLKILLVFAGLGAALAIAFGAASLVPAPTGDYFSNTKLTDQISYCHIYREWKVHGKPWHGDIALPCRAIPYRQDV